MNAHLIKKWSSLLSVAVAVVVLAVVTAWAYKNEPDGFRGVKWGSDLATLQGFHKVKSLAGMDIYERSTDSLSVGTGSVTLIWYYSWQGKFIEVNLPAGDTSVSNTAALVKALRDNFGEPTTSDAGGMVWSGTLTDICLMFGSEDTNTLIVMRSPGPYAAYKRWYDSEGKKQGF